jgi:hypothetical protein
MTKDEVIVIYGDQVVRIPIKAWQHIMRSTGQMGGDWFEEAKDQGSTLHAASIAYDSFISIAAFGN